MTVMSLPLTNLRIALLMPNLDLSYEERRERNRKLREKIKQSKLDQRGALKDPQIPAKENSGAVDTTKQGAKSTHNNP